MRNGMASREHPALVRSGVRAFVGARLPVLALGLAVAGLLAVAAAPVDAQGGSAAVMLSVDAPVAVTGGLVQGTEAEVAGVVSFKGIPFAAPPVGELRWRPPAPVVPWEGVRDAGEAGAICVQGGGQGVGQSEDCLFLNVWAPAESAEPLPVLYWIHGGGYTGGSGSTSIYDGARLASEGAVVVTINYRLNVFGFLAHPALSAESPHGASGNYGLLDMVAGLEWVRDNIASFGGDPGRVTIFGESAGGGAVMSVMLMPQSEGLFHRAIAQSNWIHGWDRPLEGDGVDLTPAEAQGVAVERELGAGDLDSAAALAAMRAAPAGEVMAAIAAGAGSPFLRTGHVWAPNVDGWTIPDDPLAMYAEGRQHPVPLMVGMNGNEGSLMTRGFSMDGPEAFAAHVESVYADDFAAELLAHYDATTETVREGFDYLVHDLYFAGPVRVHARHQSAVAPVWMYHFTRVPPTPWGEAMGAHHAAELVYVFGTLTTSDEPGERPLGLSPLGDFTEVDTGLSETMRAYWIRFAAAGDPNRPGLPAWPAWDPASDRHLELGDEVSAGEDLHVDGAELWDRFQAQRRGGR